MPSKTVRRPLSRARGEGMGSSTRRDVEGKTLARFMRLRPRPACYVCLAEQANDEHERATN
jgi:hypothetical protein